MYTLCVCGARIYSPQQKNGGYFMKKATWYGHENMNDLQVYFWYRRQFCDKTREEILAYQVEPDTVGEVAQANTLGISLKELRALKAWMSEVKTFEWQVNMPRMTEAIINVSMP